MRRTLLLVACVLALAASPAAAAEKVKIGFIATFSGPYAQAGLMSEVPFFSAFTIDETTLKAQGDAAVGTFGTAFWSADLKNAANERFVAEFRKKLGYEPSTYSAQSYDAALLLDAAIKAVGGKIEDKESLRAAFRKADFRSVRGAFKYNTNHFPIQNFYLRQVVKEGADLKLVSRGLVFSDHADVYAKDRKM